MDNNYEINSATLVGYGKLALTFDDMSDLKGRVVVIDIDKLTVMSYELYKSHITSICPVRMSEDGGAIFATCRRQDLSISIWLESLEAGSYAGPILKTSTATLLHTISLPKKVIRGDILVDGGEGVNIIHSICCTRDGKIAALVEVRDRSIDHMYADNVRHMYVATIDVTSRTVHSLIPNVSIWSKKISYSAGYIFVEGKDGNIDIYNARLGEHMLTMHSPRTGSDIVNCICHNSDKICISYDHAPTTILDLSTGARTVLDNYVSGQCCISPSGKLVTGGYDDRDDVYEDNLHLWDVAKIAILYEAEMIGKSLYLLVGWDDNHFAKVYVDTCVVDVVSYSDMKTIKSFSIANFL